MRNFKIYYNTVSNTILNNPQIKDIKIEIISYILKRKELHMKSYDLRWQKINFQLKKNKKTPPKEPKENIQN